MTNTGAALKVSEILAGDKFWHDGREYQAEGYAQQMSGPWFRVPLARWSPADPRALRLHKGDHVFRAY